METHEAIAIAASFLLKNRITFVEPGKVVPRADGLVEVIFLIPEALDPGVVIDPPDVWVLVDPSSGGASLIPIM